MNTARNRRESHPNQVRKASLLVDTAALKERGIDQIRVLSESKFLELLGGVSRSSALEPALAVSEETVVSAPAPYGQGPSAYQSKWERLRHRHEDKLQKIETGMERLSSTFHSIQEALNRLGTEEPAAGPVAAEPVHVNAPEPEVTGPRAPKSRRSQQDLLREMLL